MPKRRNEDEIGFLRKRLKQLEKDIKEARYSRRVSSSSSSSACSRRSSSSSSSSLAAPIDPDYQDDRDEAARPRDFVPPPELPQQRVAISPLPPVMAPPNNDEQIAGPSNEISPTGNIPPSVPCVDLDINNEDDISQSELLEILGVDPSSATQEYGEDINTEVACRFEHITTSGLDKEARHDLLNRYLVPKNCKKIAAPQLNAEIKAASSEAVEKRDKAIEFRQKQIAAAITGVGRMLTLQLRSRDKENNVSKQLMEVGRILCDIQYCNSETRRKFLLYSLKKDFRDQVETTKVDRYLFGENLSDTIKTAKAVSRSGTDIKMDVHKQKQGSSKLPKNLNWRAGPPARRQQKGPTPKQQPAAPASRRHGTSSHRSSHRGKQTYRR